ncbi:hypothetical protein [Lysinibacillus sp. NPDC056232]|uniref:hypothetical protein n=1 Tax=Lysinibacillus sp. NPDC056232 TaxID=3345756 RepID=UPI0035DB9733
MNTHDDSNKNYHGYSTMIVVLKIFKNKFAVSGIDGKIIAIYSTVIRRLKK